MEMHVETTRLLLKALVHVANIQGCEKRLHV
jgi:hypothetical protein